MAEANQGRFSFLSFVYFNNIIGADQTYPHSSACFVMAFMLL